MRTRGLVVFLYVCLLIVAGCAPAPTPAPVPPTAAPPSPVPPTSMPPTPAADLVAPVKTWADALNKGDVDAALAPLADSVWWTGSYHGAAGGKEQLRPLFEGLVGQEAKHQIADCQPQGSGMLCGFSIVDGCIVAYGAPDGLPSKLEFKFQPDGKIGEVAMMADDPRWKDFLNFYGAVEAWAHANRAEEVARIEVGREGGSIVVKLCKEYAATLK